MNRETQIYRNCLISTLLRKESDQYLEKKFNEFMSEIYENIPEDHYTNEDLDFLNNRTCLENRKEIA